MSASRRVLAAVDGSPVSLDVLRTAVFFGGILGACPEAVHVGPAAQSHLLRAAAEIGLRMAVQDGDAATVLKGAVAAHDVVLAALGSTGHGGSQPPSGRTAATVLASTEKPVVVVPPGSFPSKDRVLHRALVPVEGRDGSVAALRPVLDALAAAGVELDAVHVDGEDTEVLGRLMPRQDVRMLLSSGDVADEVDRVCRQEGNDLLVLTWSRDLSPGRANTLRRLLRGASCPVLLVPVVRPETIDLREPQPAVGSRT